MPTTKGVSIGADDIALAIAPLGIRDIQNSLTG